MGRFLRPKIVLFCSLSSGYTELIMVHIPYHLMKQILECADYRTLSRASHVCRLFSQINAKIEKPVEEVRVSDLGAVYSSRGKINVEILTSKFNMPISKWVLPDELGQFVTKCVPIKLYIDIATVEVWENVPRSWFNVVKDIEIKLMYANHWPQVLALFETVRSIKISCNYGTEMDLSQFLAYCPSFQILAFCTKCTRLRINDKGIESLISMMEKSMRYIAEMRMYMRLTATKGKLGQLFKAIAHYKSTFLLSPYGYEQAVYFCLDLESQEDILKVNEEIVSVSDRYIFEPQSAQFFIGHTEFFVHFVTLDLEF